MAPGGAVPGSGPEVDEHRARQRAPYVLVDEWHRLAQEAAGVGDVEAHLREDAAEGFPRQRVLAGVGGHVANQRPRHDAAPRLPQRARLGVVVPERAIARLGPRVVRLARRHPRHGVLQLFEKCLALRPPAREDEHFGGVAVEAGIVGHHAGHVARLVRQRR
jgi:hypothetical protein